MVSLVNSHSNATSWRYHLWEIDLKNCPLVACRVVYKHPIDIGCVPNRDGVSATSSAPARFQVRTCVLSVVKHVPTS